MSGKLMLMSGGGFAGFVGGFVGGLTGGLFGGFVALALLSVSTSDDNTIEIKTKTNNPERINFFIFYVSIYKSINFFSAQKTGMNVTKCCLTFYVGLLCIPTNWLW